MRFLRQASVNSPKALEARALVSRPLGGLWWEVTPLTRVRSRRKYSVTLVTRCLAVLLSRGRPAGPFPGSALAGRPRSSPANAAALRLSDKVLILPRSFVSVCYWSLLREVVRTSQWLKNNFRVKGSGLWLASKCYNVWINADFRYKKDILI